MLNTISTLWSNSIEAIEQHFNYTFSDEIKQYVKNKRIRCCSLQINHFLEEELLVLAFNPYESQCYKYGESITIRLKGEDTKLFKPWEYSGINYTMSSRDDI